MVFESTGISGKGFNSSTILCSSSSSRPGNPKSSSLVIAQYPAQDACTVIFKNASALSFPESASIQTFLSMTFLISGYPIRTGYFFATLPNLY
jgi:hypothetical protein